MSVTVDTSQERPEYDRLYNEAFSKALREAVSTPDDHDKIAAAVEKIAMDSHLDLSHEHRMMLFAAARIVKFAPVRKTGLGAP